MNLITVVSNETIQQAYTPIPLPWIQRLFALCRFKLDEREFWDIPNVREFCWTVCWRKRLKIQNKEENRSEKDYMEHALEGNNDALVRVKATHSN